MYDVAGRLTSARQRKQSLARGSNPYRRQCHSASAAPQETDLDCRYRPHGGIDRDARVAVEVDVRRGQNTSTLSASIVAAANSSIVLRRAPSMSSASPMPRASMQAPISLRLNLKRL